MFFEIGKIVKPHGLKGALKIIPFSNDPYRFKENEVYLINDREFKVEYTAKIGKCAIVKFFEINDIDNAETFRDSIVYVDEKDLVPLTENEHYVHDILECNVYDIDNTLIGKVIEITFIQNNNILDVENSDSKVFSIPFKNEFIEKIDIENKRIDLKNKKEFYEF